METVVYQIEAKRTNNRLWCSCKTVRDVYGEYSSEGQARVDLKEQIRVERKLVGLADCDIKLEFIYE